MMRGARGGDGSTAQEVTGESRITSFMYLPFLETKVLLTYHLSLSANLNQVFEQARSRVIVTMARLLGVHRKKLLS